MLKQLINKGREILSDNTETVIEKSREQEIVTLLNTLEEKSTILKSDLDTDKITDDEFLKSFQELRSIESELKVELESLEKGGKGEGSKGGKIIGHTKSGKPVYDKFSHLNHKDFTKEDHQDAAKTHNKYKFKNYTSGDKKEDFLRHSKEERKHNESWDDDKTERNKKDFSSITSKEIKEVIKNKFNGDYKKAAIYYNMMDGESDLKERIAAKEKFANNEAVEKVKESKSDDFKHHRLMAGYHESKEKELYSEQEDLRSSSDKDLHKVADKLESQRKHHNNESNKHHKIAQSLHDLKKHGRWDDSTPTHDEAIKYGEKKQTIKKSEETSNIETSKQYYIDCLIYNKENELLLLRRSNNDSFEPNKWCLPGGKLEEGETIKQAVIREVLEETNIKLKSDQISLLAVKETKEVCIYYFIYSNFTGEDFKIILDNDEHINYEFCSQEKRSKMKLLLDLNDALDTLQNYSYSDKSEIKVPLLDETNEAKGTKSVKVEELK